MGWPEKIVYNAKSEVDFLMARNSTPLDHKNVSQNESHYTTSISFPSILFLIILSSLSPRGED